MFFIRKLNNYTILQLLSLWESKINLEDVVLMQLKNPVESWGAFEKGLIEEFPQVVATINQHIDATFEVMYFKNLDNVTILA